jgi:hypothetical protein
LRCEKEELTYLRNACKIHAPEIGDVGDDDEDVCPVRQTEILPS